MIVQIDRETAGRLGVSMQTIIDTLDDAFGQRQISTIYRAGQPVPRDPGGDAAIPERPELAHQALCAGGAGTQAAAVSTSLTVGRMPTLPHDRRRHAGAAERLRAVAAHHRAAW